MNSVALYFCRAFVRYYAILLAGLGFGLWVFNYFTGDSFFVGQHLYLRGGLVVLLLIILPIKAWSYFRSESDNNFLDLELALLSLLLINILIQFSGQYGPYLYALNFLLFTLIVAYSNLWISLVLALFLAGMESLASYYAGAFQAQMSIILLHLFTSMLFLFFVGQLLLLERKQSGAAEAALDKLRRDGQRLDPTGESAGMERISPEAREQSNVDHLFIQDKILGGLAEIARRALEAHTVIFMTLDYDNVNLSVNAYASESDDIDIHAPVSLGDSIFSMAVRSGQSVKIDKLSPENTPQYYTRRVRIKSLLVTPIFRANHVVGIVAADALEEEHFAQVEGDFIELVAQQVMENEDNIKLIRTILNEREQFAAFYEVSNQILTAMKMDDVHKVVLSASSSIAKYDMAVLTLVDDVDNEVSTIEKVLNIPDKDLVGARFHHNEGLVGWVTQLNTYLSHPDYTKVKRPIFSSKIKMKNVKGLLCLPLSIKDRAVGTLTFFWNSTNAFNEFDRKILEVLVMQAAASIENARIYEKMEKMAITDGLTGLHNHRYFQEWFSTEIDRAFRMPIQISMILCDIDHFKNVNDTYGHPVGDIVLKEIAHIMKDSVRKIDLAARYGGEEFALVLLDTDKKGAIKLAERIRKTIENTQIKYPDGELSVTISMGVATFPGDGKEKQVIIDLADTSLYYAKRTGRNKATHASDLPPASEMPPPENSDR